MRVHLLSGRLPLNGSYAAVGVLPACRRDVGSGVPRGPAKLGTKDEGRRTPATWALRAFLSFVALGGPKPASEASVECV
jgi:hypothetical protein